MTTSVAEAPPRNADRQLRPALAEALRCPSCGGRLAASAPPPIREGTLRCPAGHTFAVKDGIPLLSPNPLSEVELTAGGFGTSDERQRVYWESDLDHREVAHPVVAGFSRQRWAHVAKRIPMAEVRDLLDVGCGNGFSTAYAPAGLRAVGCDASLRMLARHPGPEVVMAEATKLPFADSQFDLVTCWEVLHHVAEPWKVLSEMARVARRFVVVFEPNPLNPAQFAFALADREHRWVLRYSRAYLLDQFRRAGLSCSSFERVGVIFPNKTPSWLYPLLARVPYEMPLVGISQLVVARKQAGDGMGQARA